MVSADGWEPLCELIGAPVPVPRTNDVKTFATV
jgi:Sulfotransferase domain